MAAHAATYTVPALTGASIQATINTAAGAGSNNTVFFPAGFYSISSSITVPCSNGLILTGPVANPATAVLNATFGGNSIFTMGGCTGVTFEYLKTLNTGAIYVSSGNASNISILHNQFGALPSSIGGASNASAAIYFDGNINTTVDHTTITYNTFGDANSCTAVFNNQADQGGYCAGFYNSAGTFSNAVIDYNTFNHVEEGLHLHQILSNFTTGNPESVVNNVQIQYNYCVNWHRICMEIQAGVVGTAITVSDNAYANPINPSYITFAISMACCQWGRTYHNSNPPNPAQLTQDNVIYTQFPQTVGSFHAPVLADECWGADGTSCSNNLVEGVWGTGIAWGYANHAGQLWYVQNNYFCATYGGNYISDEEHQGSMWAPVTSGNTTSATCTQQISTAPSISPAPGAYTSPPLVTLSNGGRNTSTYYTTDGSTPVPGSGTTQLYTGPFAITLPVTVKTVGMWGDGSNQPLSYPAPYGYVPSAVQSASYTATGGVVLSSVALSDTGAVHSIANGTSIQMTATCTYSDGATTNCNTPDSRGNGVSTWNADNASVGISSSGLATGASIGSANLSATVAGLTTPNWTMAVTGTALSLSSVSLATTGGISSLAVGAANQLIATCGYSDGSTTNCTSTDAHGNGVSFASTAPMVATVNGTGVVSAIGAGGTSLSASVNPVISTWGQTASDISGTAGSGFIHSLYFVFSNQAGGYSGNGGTCSFFLPTGTLTVGSHFDCGLILAPTPTTQASSWLCWGTYTVSSSTAPNAFVTVPMNSCGSNIASGTAAWVAVSLDASSRPNIGFNDCGGSCNGAAPASGSGTYPYYYIADTYGVRTGMATAMTMGTVPANTEVSQYVTMGQSSITSNSVPLTVAAAPPTLASAYLAAPGGGSTMTVGGTLQFSAHCVYSDSSTTDCTVADIHGNAVTVWSTSDATKVSIGQIGAANPGLATAVAAGTASIQANIGSLLSSAYELTVANAAVTLMGISLATTGGVTGLFIGSTNALVATCVYSDGSSTNCTTTDSHGNQAGGYASSAPSHATVNASTGVVTGVAAGTTTLSAGAGSFTSMAIPLTVLAVPSGTYFITITGPVSFSGRVQF